MPTYEYQCTVCSERLEVVQRFSDDPLTTCEPCGGALRRVFHPVGVVLKGSGFYATDNRSGKALQPSEKKSESPSSGSSSPSKSDSGSSKPSSSSPSSGTGSSGTGSSSTGSSSS